MRSQLVKGLSDTACLVKLINAVPVSRGTVRFLGTQRLAIVQAPSKDRIHATLWLRSCEVHCKLDQPLFGVCEGAVIALRPAGQWLT